MKSLLGIAQQSITLAGQVARIAMAPMGKHFHLSTTGARPNDEEKLL